MEAMTRTGKLVGAAALIAIALVAIITQFNSKPGPAPSKPRVILVPALVRHQGNPGPLAGGGSVLVGNTFAHWFSHHAHARSVCGVPVSNPQWHGGNVSQPFQGCTLHGHIWFSRNAHPQPTATPAPSPTPFPVRPTPPPASCASNGTGCDVAMLQLLNQTRAQYGQPPLQWNATQAKQAVIHSTDMALSGQIWHVDGAYPSASFPAEIVVGYSWAGENVGMAGGQGAWGGLQTIHNEMMAEQHDAAYCATYDNHACNILASHFSQIGIGVYVDASGSVWLTEDLTG